MRPKFLNGCAWALLLIVSVMLYTQTIRLQAQLYKDAKLRDQQVYNVRVIGKLVERIHARDDYIARLEDMVEPFDDIFMESPVGPHFLFDLDDPPEPLR